MTTACVGAALALALPAAGQGGFVAGIPDEPRERAAPEAAPEDEGDTGAAAAREGAPEVAAPAREPGRPAPAAAPGTSPEGAPPTVAGSPAEAAEAAPGTAAETAPETATAAQGPPRAGQAVPGAGLDATPFAEEAPTEVTWPPGALPPEVLDALQAAVAARIAENLEANDGFFVADAEPHLMLYLEYLGAPVPAEERDVWLVPGEFRTLQQEPSSYPVIEEAGAMPDELDMAPAQVTRRVRAVRDALSYELTFQVERRGDTYEVTDVWISERPPGAPPETPYG